MVLEESISVGAQSNMSLLPSVSAFRSVTLTGAGGIAPMVFVDAQHIAEGDFDLPGFDLDLDIET